MPTCASGQNAMVSISMQQAFANRYKIYGMNNQNSVNKEHIVKAGLHDKRSDYAYWQSQSYEERLSQLEQCRIEYHRWKYGAEPRLQRVYTIVKR